MKFAKSIDLIRGSKINLFHAMHSALPKKYNYSNHLVVFSATPVASRRFR